MRILIQIHNDKHISEPPSMKQYGIIARLTVYLWHMQQLQGRERENWNWNKIICGFFSKLLFWSIIESFHFTSNHNLWHKDHPRNDQCSHLHRPPPPPHHHQNPHPPHHPPHHQQERRGLRCVFSIGFQFRLTGRMKQPTINAASVFSTIYSPKSKHIKGH